MVGDADRRGLELEAIAEVEHRNPLAAHVDDAFNRPWGVRKRQDRHGSNHLAHVGRTQRAAKPPEFAEEKVHRLFRYGDYIGATGARETSRRHDRCARRLKDARRGVVTS